MNTEDKYWYENCVCENEECTFIRCFRSSHPNCWCGQPFNYKNKVKIVEDTFENAWAAKKEFDKNSSEALK